MSANNLTLSANFMAALLSIFLSVNSNPISQDLLHYGSISTTNNVNIHMDETTMIKRMIQYSQYSNLLDSCNTDPTLYSNLNDFVQTNHDKIYNAYIQNVEICNSLDLKSQACFEDCIYYVSPLGLLEDNTTDPQQIRRILQWYQMGGDPFGWYSIGNPDMCSFSDGTYCFTPIQITMDFFTINLQEHGCCVPGTCTGDDAVKVLQQNVYCYQGYNQTYAQQMFFGLFGITNICEPLPRNLSSLGFIAVVTVFFIFFISVVIASIYTQNLREKQKIDTKISDDDIYDSNWFLYCFSIQRLWKIFNARRPANKSQFNFLDGIRFVSMCWVIYGHVYVLYLVSSPSNQAVLMAPGPGSLTPSGANPDKYPYVFNELYMMVAEYGFYSVDSFYFISGFLAAFSIHRQLKKYSLKKAVQTLHVWVPLVYLHRLLRIFPMMAFVMFIQWHIADQLSYGYHVSSREGNAGLCSSTWYQILLFYSNLTELNDLGCMGHLWYVQCDMQMFLLLPWIMILFKWKTLVGIIAAAIPFFVCIGIRFYFAFYYHFGANFLAPAYPAINGGDQQQQYFKPWGRMAPYFIGIVTMLSILTLKEYNFEIRARWSYLGLVCLSCFIMLCLVFWPYGDVKNAPLERWSLLSNQLYYAFSRPVWGVALSLLSFALVFKYKRLKSMIGSLLALDIYQPLAKLTYTMYLIHMMVLFWFFQGLNTSIYYEFWWVICIFMGLLAVTLGLTVILWFIMEQPLANLVAIFMKWLTMKKKTSMDNKSKHKDSISSELANITKKKFKANKTNGYNIIDRLLVEGSTGKVSATYDYESCVDTAHQTEK